MGRTKKKGKQGEYDIAPDARRIVPLKGGFCYIYDLKGKLHHVKKDTEAFDRLVEELRTGLSEDRMIEELRRVGRDE